MQQPGLWALLVFLAWTLTSYACHQTGKLFLAALAELGPSLPVAVAPVILTTTQLAVCLLTVNVPLEQVTLSSLVAMGGVGVVTGAHALATLATNLSMATMQAASTFAIKMAEPVTSALAQRLLLNSPASPRALWSLPAIVVGAVMFAGDPLSDKGVGVGVLLAMVSNVVLAVRNVAVKRQHDHSRSFPLRSRHRVLLLLLASLSFLTVAFALESTELLPEGVTFALAMLLLSATGHVAYSYISTGVVLRHLSVISHAVCNILKRVLVVALLYSAGKRRALWWNWAGLVVAMLGLALYTSDKVSLTPRGVLLGAGRDHGPHDADSMRRPRYLTRVLAVSLLMLAGWACYHMTVLNSSYPTVLLATSPTEESQEQLVDHEFKRLMQRMGERADSSEDLPPVPSSDFSALDRQVQEMVGEDFFDLDLVQFPEMVNKLSPLLRTSRDVIAESQRLHFQVFKQLLGGFQYAMLFDMAAFENKGDPAITAGEIYLLRRLGIEMAYYCNFYACKDGANLRFARSLADRFPEDSLVVLLHGGGSVVGYPENDFLRFRVLELFQNYSVVMFPQSIWIHGDNKSASHLQKCSEQYSFRPNLQLVLRDEQSLAIARKHFKETRQYMLPDMAFQMGAVPRFMAPVFDILWLRRTDKESPGYKPPRPPPGVTMHVADWWKWLTPKGTTSMEDALLMATNGFLFLQRGRVVVTDRLHGHILSTLCDIPHVLIDNKVHKLSSYYNTWTRGLENVVLVNNSQSALQAALTLLDSARPPPVLPYMEAPELVSVQKKKMANASAGVKSRSAPAKSKKASRRSERLSKESLVTTDTGGNEKTGSVISAPLKATGGHTAWVSNAFREGRSGDFRSKSVPSI